MTDKRGGQSSSGAPLKTMRMDVASGSSDDLVRALKSPYRPMVVILRGNDVGQRKIVDRNLSVGRNPASDLVLTDPSVSWNHARIEDRGDAWAVVDLGSTNGTCVNGEAIIDALLTPNDKISFGRTVGAFQMQDEIEQAFDDIVERMLNVDDLSGLYVRRKFDAELQAMLQVAQRDRRSVGLLVMDLDGIKQINDTHGHLFGAYVIGEAGRVIGDMIVGKGIGARFGGDEYIAGLPNLDLQQAVAVANEILEAIRRHSFLHEGVVLHPGISIGVASFPESAADPKALFQLADAALYRAKRAGKNRVCQ